MKTNFSGIKANIDTAIKAVDLDGAHFRSGVFLDWATFRQAAKQQDPELAHFYAELLERFAKGMYLKTFGRKNPDATGTPIATGMCGSYHGQSVRKCWEIRGSGNKYTAQILRRESGFGYRETPWQSIPMWRSEKTSPSFDSTTEARQWVSEHYGTWDNEFPFTHGREAWA